MNIFLRWSRNINTPELDNVYIYRDTVRKDTLVGNEPLAVLDGTADSYTDTTAIQGTVYYYQVVFAKGADRGLGPIKTIRASNFSGIGPTDIVRGDSYLGLYGYMTHEEVLTQVELRALVPGVGGSSTTSSDLHWIKAAVKGKILLIPRFPINYNVKWEDIYASGAVYGTDDTGYLPDDSGITPVIQDRRITIEGSVYKVRLPEGLSTPERDILSIPMTPTYDLIGHEHSELALILNAFAERTSPIHPYYKLDSFTQSELMVSTSYATICQEIDQTSVSGSVRPLIMSNGISTNYSPSAATVATDGTSTSINTTAYISWRPILELTEE